MQIRIAGLALLLAAPGCLRTFRPQEQARRDTCATRLPIYREPPDRPYRVVKIVRAKDENDLAWRACAERADAVIALGRSEDYETRATIGSTGNIAAGRTRTERSDLFEGEAIVFTPY